MSKQRKKSGSGLFIIIILLFIFLLYREGIIGDTYSTDELETTVSYSKYDIPDYDGNSYVIINNNIPYFDSTVNYEFEDYAPLDNLGRCTYAYANVSLSTMPTEERERLFVRPSGWQISKYDFIDGQYLYNRCHLIGYQLTGENDNERNLITCTREMNTGVMLTYENKVANYIRRTSNHVLYRVTPIFDGDNLLAKGVMMEGFSIEDNGAGIKFNIFVYNVQDGVIINYENGDNYPE